MITAERLRELLSYDPETGLFTHKKWRPGLSRSDVGKVAGAIVVDGYCSVCVDNKRYLAHRLAWLHVHGVWPRFEIDHINGARDDNRITNLRDVSRKLNAQNLRCSMPKTLMDAPLGVSWHQKAKKWRAMIWDGKKNIYLGLFADAKEAHEEYVRAKRHIHAGCTL